MRLIDADAERERLKKGYCEECTRKGNYGIFGAACTPCWVKDAIEEFDNAQGVEAEPVRHGRWIFKKGDNKSTVDGWICTNCKYGFHTKVPYFEAFMYCPMCGARMDEGADNG